MMLASSFAATVTTAVVVFVSTNIDDIVLLSVLFADPTLRSGEVVAGQFVGIGLLVLTSAVAGAAAIAVPSGWTSLLGAIPLAVGLAKAVGLLRSRARDDEPEAGVMTAVRHTEGRSHIAAVVGVTLANGGDNLSAYIPIFAADRTAILIYPAVFAALTGLWCLLGYRLVNNRVFGNKLKHYGHRVLPIVLIGLGLHILYDARNLLR